MATNYSAIRDDALGAGDMTDLLTALKRREVSPQELHDAARERLRDAQPVLNAVVVPTDVPSGSGPLAGIPTVLKDNLDLAGYATREGSRAVPDRVHTQDSAFTADLKATGVAFLAKSTLPEFGLTASTEPLLTGPTRNPWHLDRSTGGSSGGSAALVASGAVPVAHANDGGGSIRIPASCCGLVGLKVSRGRVTDAASEKFLPVSIASEGVVTRSVRDTALLYSLLERPMAGTPPIGHVRGPGKRRLRIAMVTQGVPVQHVDDEVTAAVVRTGALLADLGHHVEPTTLALSEQFGRDFLRYWAALAAVLQLGGGRMFGPGWDGEQLEPLTKGLAEYCRTMVTGVPGTLRRLRAFPRTYANLFADCDAILSPVLAAPPVPLGYLAPDLDPRTHIVRLLRYASFTAAQNVAGAPGIAVPAGTSAEGTPIGIHLGGPFGSEASLLELAYELEAAAPFPALQVAQS
jgi:amidase